MTTTASRGHNVLPYRNIADTTEIQRDHLTMSDQHSTQLYFLAGLVAALVLVPLVALAATALPIDE